MFPPACAPSPSLSLSSSLSGFGLLKSSSATRAMSMSISSFSLRRIASISSIDVPSMLARTCLTTAAKMPSLPEQSCSNSRSLNWMLMRDFLLLARWALLMVGASDDMMAPEATRRKKKKSNAFLGKLEAKWL